MLLEVYVNYDEREIYSEVDFIEKLNEETQKIIDDDDELDQWLGEQFYYSELFKMSEEEKEKNLNEWENIYAPQKAEDFLFSNGWHKEILDI